MPSFSSRRRFWIGYLIPVLVTAVAILTWFSDGRFIASGDVGPFYRDNLMAELPSLWTHQNTPTGGQSYTLAGALETVLILAADAIGMSSVVAQYLLYVCCFGAAAAGASHFAATWVRHPEAICFAGLFGVFNAYQLVSHPNPLPALAIGVIGLLCGQILRAGRGHPVRPAGIAVVTLGCSYLSLNPPLLLIGAFACLASVLAGRLLAGPEGFRRSGLLLVRALPWMLLINLWWITPLGLTLFGPHGPTIGAELDIRTWSWTHARADLANVLSLNAHWGWLLGYFPYAESMETGWRWLKWTPLTLAVLGVMMATTRKRAAWLMAAGLCLLACFATGLNPPFGAVNLWLFEHVPGLWLLREPMAKVGILLVLGYAALAALAVDRALSLGALRLRSPLRRHPWRPLEFVVALLAIGALAYPWPMWTGEVAPTVRGHLPGARIEVPAQWREVADTINSIQVPGGRTLLLPINEYYQVTTTWGYHGVDTVPAQLLRDPVLNSSPGGYFANPGTVESSLRDVQTGLMVGDTEQASNAMRRLGITIIVVRHDLKRDDGEDADPGKLAEAMASHTSAETVVRTPLADVFRLPGAPGVIRAGTDTMTAVIRARQGLNPVSLQSSGMHTVSRRSAGPQPYRVTVSGKTLTLTDATRAKVGELALPERPALEIPLKDRRPVAIAHDGRIQPLTDRTLVYVGASTHVAAYAPSGAGQAVPAFSELGDCANLGDSTAQFTLERFGPGSVRLSANRHSACVSAPVPVTSDLKALHVTANLRSVRGAPPRLCLWQHQTQRCLALSAPVFATPAQDYSGWATLDPAQGPVSLFVYADSPGHTTDEQTTTDYNNVRITGLREVGGAVLTSRIAEPVSTTMDSPEATVNFALHDTGEALGPFTRLGNCANSNTGDPGHGLSTDEQGEITLTASADSACVSAPLITPAVGAAYEVNLEMRTETGSPARVCVWQEGPNRCASLPPVSRSQHWQTLTAQVRPAPGTTAIWLYLYADGQRGQPTRAQYRNATIQPAPAESVAIQPVVTQTPPTVVTTGASPDRYSARIHGLDGSVTLVLAETFAPGWRIAGMPPFWTAQHQQVDGFANGWLITGSGAGEITIVYQPRVLADTSILISALTALILAVQWLVARRP